MILDRIQHYLGIVFFTTLVIMQALIFVAVKASSDDNLLQAVFIEPISENISIDESVYFQAMLSTKDDSIFNFVYFSLKNLETGLDENYQASLKSDGTWIAQNAWDTSYGYKPGEYYLSATAYTYKDGIPANIYSSDYELINLVGEITAQQITSGSITESMGEAFFSSPLSGPEIDPVINPLLDIVFNIEDTLNNTVIELTFDIISSDGVVNDFLPAIKAISNYSENGYAVWVNEESVDLSNFTDGLYSIVPQIDTGIISHNFNISPATFNIVSSAGTTADPTETPTADPTGISSIQILEPLEASIIDQDQLNISVTTNKATQAGQVVLAKFINQNLGLLASYELVPRDAGLSTHEILVDLADLNGEAFPNGIYIINFELSDQSTSLGQVSITINRTSITAPDPEIILNSPVAGSVVNGDILLLDFTTNFSATNLIFTLVKENNAAEGMNGAIDLIGGGTSWQTSVSAQANTLTNGNYTILASANIGGGTFIELRSVSFEWQITKTDVSVIPEEILLFSYQPLSSQVGPGDILVASSNVLDIEFRLQSLIDTSLDYALDYIATDCNNSSVISRGTLEGHTNCFYYMFPSNTADIIPNGNYNFFIKYTDSDDVAISAPVLLSYFNEANQEETTPPSDNSEVTEGTSTEEGAPSDTSEESSQAEEETTPPSDNSEVTEGTSTEEGAPSDTSEEEEASTEETGSEANTGGASLAIDFYATCHEEGIDDQERCEWFQATMDMLDGTCIEQGIYDAVACEDYLYRIQTDLECQENNILEREECKNYLLEKYGAQVDCQLEDNNTCNNILRNEYLNRLVSGQRLSENINATVDSLLGTNISIQELSDHLEDRGINSQEILPLSPNKDIKVLIARAQKEIILEEEDKLTILNQAVIILDTDGDGLSDDLEEYYGTDINNPDTDGDGYTDGTEIKNGYNPAGEGALTQERTNFDIVILDIDKIIEQPKVKSIKIDKRMEVENVDTQDTGIKLSGKAEANTWVNLYLYSGLPLVMTTKTDASGNWSYDIKNSLTDGHHRVFVTINDDTGKIVKQSRPISFLIKEAQAVTVDNYFDETSSAGAVNNLFIYYILGGVFLVFLALGVIVYLHKGKNQNLEV